MSITTYGDGKGNSSLAPLMQGMNHQSSDSSLLPGEMDVS